MKPTPAKPRRVPPPTPMPEPMSGLSPDAVRWFSRIAKDYKIEDGASLMVLQHALQSWDIANKARATVESEGQTVLTSTGRPVAHPCWAISRDAHAAFRSAMRQLNFDTSSSPKDGPGRPPVHDGYADADFEARKRRILGGR